MTVENSPATGETPTDAPPSGPSGDVHPPSPDGPEPTPGGDPEELGEKGKRAIEAERKARRDAEARLKELEPLAKAAAEKAEAEKTELTKANEALTAERDARTKAEAALMRYEVGAEKSVPAKLVPFLQGTTREEIAASADALLAEIGPAPTIPGRPSEKVATGRPSNSLDGLDPIALINKARGEKSLPI